MKLARFLAGIVSGVTFGVLFAPKQGKKLRKEITQGKDIKALGEAFKNAGVDALEEIKKLSKHEQVEAFLQLSEDKLKEIASNLDEGNSEMIRKAKVKFEEISAFALQKAHDLKGVLSDEGEENFKTKPVYKKKAATKKMSPKKKPILKSQTRKAPATVKKTSSNSKKNV